MREWPKSIACSAYGFGPLEFTIGIQLDDIDIGISCAEGEGEAGDGVAAIGGLNEGEASRPRFFRRWFWSIGGFHWHPV
jgi:hypothetical protein